ncbi:MAG: HAMP domain-containing protein [Kiritimatiellaeota bacterium]|nr:HAMP domain-containing protein [Kiritimatiellota bacterium]
MCLKKEHNFFRTLKFKLTLHYAGLFLLSSLFLFVCVYYTSYSYIVNKTKRNLAVLSRTLEQRLLKGEDDEDENIQSLDQVPSAIIAAAERKIPNLKPVYGKINEVNGETLYEVAGVSGQNIYEIKLTSSGKIIEIEKSRLDDGLQALRKEIDDVTNERGVNTIFIVLFSKNGEILAKSDLTRWRQKITIEKKFNLNSSRKTSFRVIAVSDGEGHVCVLQRRMFNGAVLSVGVSIKPEEELLDAYLNIFIAIIAFLLVFGSLTGWFIAGKSMAGVHRVTATAAKIKSGGDLSKRVPLGGEGLEIELLVVAFNEMLARINLLVSELKEVSDNIAHDLRTPITRIRGIVETTVSSKPDAPALMEMSADVVEECDRLIEIVNTMLEITQTDAGVIKPASEDVDLTRLLADAYELFTPMAEEKRIDFKLEVLDRPVIFKGDKSRLQRIMANLIDNAIKYTDEGGAVSISLKRDDEGVIAWRLTHMRVCGVIRRGWTL